MVHVSCALTSLWDRKKSFLYFGLKFFCSYLRGYTLEYLTIALSACSIWDHLTIDNE